MKSLLAWCACVTQVAVVLRLCCVGDGNVMLIVVVMADPGIRRVRLVAEQLRDAVYVPRYHDAEEDR